MSHLGVPCMLSVGQAVTARPGSGVQQVSIQCLALLPHQVLSNSEPVSPASAAGPRDRLQSQMFTQEVVPASPQSSNPWSPAGLSSLTWQRQGLMDQPGTECMWSTSAYTLGVSGFPLHPPWDGEVGRSGCISWTTYSGPRDHELLPSKTHFAARWKGDALGRRKQLLIH